MGSPRGGNDVGLKTKAELQPKIIQIRPYGKGEEVLHELCERVATKGEMVYLGTGF